MSGAADQRPGASAGVECDVEVSCHSEIVEKNAHFKNYSALCHLKEKGEWISAPLFDFGKDNKFYLKLYPKGEEQEESLALYLYFEGPKSLLYDFSADIRTSGEGCKTFRKKMGEQPSFRLHEPGVDNGWGWKKFCENKSVQNAPHLEVKVKVWVTDPSYKVNQTLTSSSDEKARGPQAVADDWIALYKSGDLSDMTIVVSGGVDKNVHGSVLAARSAVFKANLSSGMKEAKEKRIDLSDIEEETANHFIHFLYGGMLDGNIAQPLCLDLLAIGKRYEVPSLVEEVGGRLIDKLDVENCARLLSVADRYGCDRLRQAAVHFLFFPIYNDSQTLKLPFLFDLIQ